MGDYTHAPRVPRTDQYGPEYMEKLARRFKRGYCVSRSGCWEWQKATTPAGYGKIYAFGSLQLAHRISFFLAQGRWPSELCLHRCDNPACCNPNHLFDGTQSDNLNDMFAKGRGHKHFGPNPAIQGENHVHSKLTTDQVREIIARRANGERQKDLASEFGVHYNHIGRLFRGERWGHLEGHGQST